MDHTNCLQVAIKTHSFIGRLHSGFQERVFVAYFRGGEPAYFLFCTEQANLLLFAVILHFFMTYFTSAGTKQSSRAATCL